MVLKAAKVLSNHTALVDLLELLLLKAMALEAAQALVALLNEIEQTCTWPIHALMTVSVLMGKPPPGGLRPIALMPMIYRLRGTFRKSEVDQ